MCIRDRNFLIVAGFVSTDGTMTKDDQMCIRDRLAAARESILAQYDSEGRPASH